MKNFLKKVSSGVLSLLSCCSAINAKGNLGLEKNKLSRTQEVPKLLGKKRNRTVKDIAALTAIIGTPMLITALWIDAMNRVLTGTSLIDVAVEKIHRSYIEKNFDKLVSPHMDINYFKDGGPNNVKEYLIDIMTKGYTKLNNENRTELSEDEILPFSLALEFDLLKLFESTMISEQTIVSLEYSGYEPAKPVEKSKLENEYNYGKLKIKVEVGEKGGSHTYQNQKEIWMNIKTGGYFDKVKEAVENKIRCKELDIIDESRPNLLDVPKFKIYIVKHGFGKLNGDGKIRFSLCEQLKS